MNSGPLLLCCRGLWYTGSTILFYQERFGLSALSTHWEVMFLQGGSKQQPVGRILDREYIL